MESEELLRRQQSVAHLAGAIARDLNSPLQGALCLMAVCKEESGRRARPHIELVHEALLRISQIVECLSAAYENLPRPPDEMAVACLLDMLCEDLSERGIATEANSEASRNLVILVFARELVRLIREAFSDPPGKDGHLQISMSAVEGRAVLRCERELPDAAEPWCGLVGHDVCSGLAVLIDEMTKLAGGEPEFRFDHASLRGVRLCFRTRMN